MEERKVKSQDEFGLFVAQMIDACLNEGFEIPLHFVAIAADGGLIAGSFKEGEGCLVPEFAAQHLPDDRGLMILFNLFFTDGTGKAARALIKEPEETLKRKILH